MIRKFTSAVFLITLAAMMIPRLSLAQDAGVSAVIVPENNKCGATTTTIYIIVKNYGSNSLTNIPVAYEIGSTIYEDTLKSTLASGFEDTVVLTHSTSTASGGTWPTKIYTRVSSDADKTNDTLKTLHVRFKPLSAPKVKDTVRCGSGPATLGSEPTKSPVQTRWYKDSTTIDVAYIGDTVNTTLIAKDTFFYAAQVYDTITLKGDIETKPSYGTTLRLNSGHMFDITAKKDLVIDSFAMFAFYNTGNDEVELFYKKGTYVGSETNSSAWTYVGSHSIYKPGKGKRVGIPLGGIKMIPGAKYGIYLRLKSELRDITYPCLVETACSQPDSTRENDDLKITTGSTLDKNWGTGPLGLSASRDWDGQVYYSIGADCKSSRTKINIKVKPSPVSAKIIQGKPYKGYFSDGTMANPDLICPGDSVQYELQPPTGMKNSDLGSKWFIRKVTFTTPSGTGPFVKDTVTFPPSLVANARFLFIPSAKAADSTYVLTVEMEIAGGCKGSVSRVISVGSKPTARFGFVPVCVGERLDLIDSATVPSGVNTYTYTMGNGDVVTQANGSYVYTQAGTYTITQVVTTSRGCVDSTKRTIVMYDKPEPKFGFIPSCEGKPFQFFDSTTTQGIASRLWRFGPKGATSTAQNPTYTYANAGTYSVWLVLTSMGGCKDSLKQTITVLAKPKPAFDYTLACVGKNIKFTNKSTNATGSMTYLWNFGDGVTSTLKDPDYAYLDPGTYEVSLVVSNSQGCRDTIKKMITPYAIPYADFRFTEVCEGDLNEFFDSSDNAGNYTWYFGDGTAPSAQKNTKHKYNKAGIYDVTLVVASPAPAGCIDSMTKQVRVHPIPKASFTAQTVCLGKATPFTNNSTGTGLSYLWTFESGKTSTDENPSYTFTSSGNHDVTLQVTNSNGCMHSTTITVNVADAPTNSYTWVYYQGHTRNIKFTPANTTYSKYRWYFGDGDSSSDVSPIHLFGNPNGVYVVTLAYEDAAGCRGVFIDTVKLGSSNGIGDGKAGAAAISIFPNPFSHSTTLSYELVKRTAVHVEVEDMQGRVIAVLYDGMKEAGKHSHLFDAAEHKAAPGTYLLKLSVGESYHVSRIIYVE